MPGSNSEGLRYSVVVVSSECQLSQHLEAWDDLAGQAAEPNAFYESWALLPAIRTFTEGIDLRFVLVYAHSDIPDRRPLLCGFFPLKRDHTYRFAPWSILELWQHPFCYVCTPLVRQGHSIAAIDTLFDWLGNDRSGAALLRLDRAYADGAFFEGLTEVCRRRLRPTFLVSTFQRGVIRRQEDAATYLKRAVSGLHLKHFRRQERLLKRRGVLDLRTLTRDDNSGQWANMFLSLESSGWKGRNRSATNCDQDSEAFFRELVEGAFGAGKLEMMGLFLDGHPVAINCNLISGDCSFAFRTAFDEKYSNCSPGMLLALKNIEALHASTDVKRMDPCTWPDHWWLNRLCLEDRTVIDLHVASSPVPGDWLIMLKRVRRWTRGFTYGRRRSQPTGGSEHSQSAAPAQRDGSDPSAPMINQPGSVTPV